MEPRMKSKEKENGIIGIKEPPSPDRRQSETHASTDSVLLREELAGVGRRSTGLLAQSHQSHLGGVFFRVVDVLAIVPVPGGDVLPLDGDGAGPSCAAA